MKAEAALLKLVRPSVRSAYKMRDGASQMSKHRLPHDPKQSNRLTEAVALALIRAHRQGGEDALRKQFAKLYPGQVPRPSEEPKGNPAA